MNRFYLPEMSLSLLTYISDMPTLFQYLITGTVQDAVHSASIVTPSTRSPYVTAAAPPQGLQQPVAVITAPVPALRGGVTSGSSVSGMCMSVSMLTCCSAVCCVWCCCVLCVVLLCVVQLCVVLLCVVLLCVVCSAVVCCDLSSLHTPLHSTLLLNTTLFLVVLYCPVSQLSFTVLLCNVM